MEASDSTIPELPEDIIIRILVRLPVKSLLCCKAVCKTWNHFLKTPSFISMHHKFNATVSQFLICSPSEKEGMNNLADPNARYMNNLADLDARHMWIGAFSCNGIVYYYDNKHNDIFLSNAATGQLKQLPPTSFHLGSDQEFYQIGVVLGFDSTNIYDFKVLRLFCKKGYPIPFHNSFRPEIYTLSSNTWNQLHWGLDDSVQFIYGHGLFCANSFHFIAYQDESKEYTIVCCDIHTERFRTMQLPSMTRNGHYNCHSLLVFKELLSLRRFTEEKLPEIWIMKDYGVVESWTKLYSIGRPWEDSIPLCFCPGEDALLLVQPSTNKLVSYHLNTQSYEPIEIQGYDIDSQLVVYEQTLVSIM